MPLPRKPSSSPSPLPSTPSSNSPSAGANGNAGNFLYRRGQSFLHQRRLTRQRKLRHLSDYDVGLQFTDDSSLPASPHSSLKSRSSGGSEHWSSSAVPQPLPLPELPLTRRPESTAPSPGHLHLGSPSLEHPGFAFGR